VRPSGHNIKSSFDRIDAGGSIPANVVEDGIAFDMLKFGNNAANDGYLMGCGEAGIKPHPARFPAALPEFFIRLLSDPGDVVLDPFAGSNTTGQVADGLRRRWLAFEQVEDYLKGSVFRFNPPRRRDPEREAIRGASRTLF
jgi:site-specific DNA-methyltransferase (cytosine-N4-specific)